MTAFVALTRNEMRLFLRDPTGVFWVLGFPIALLVIFGCIPAFRAVDPDTGLRLINTYTPVVVVLSLTLPSLSGLPAVFATYREQLILKRLSTTPVGPRVLLGAQLVENLFWSVLMIAAMLLVARIAFDVPFAGQFVGYVLVLVLIAAALLSIGLLIAALAPTSKVAQAVGSILFFPLMFFAGLWIPLPLMPDVLRRISEYTPLGAGVQALQQAADGSWPSWSHLGVLVGYVLVAGLLAARFFRWE